MMLTLLEPRWCLTRSSSDTLPRLSLLVEILGTKSLPGSLDLISCLLDTLNKVVQSLPPAQADVNYIEQLLMSAMESVSSKITVYCMYSCSNHVHLKDLFRLRTCHQAWSDWISSSKLFEVCDNINSFFIPSGMLTPSQFQAIHKLSTKLCC